MLFLAFVLLPWSPSIQTLYDVNNLIHHPPQSQCLGMALVLAIHDSSPFLLCCCCSPNASTQLPSSMTHRATLHTVHRTPLQANHHHNTGFITTRMLPSGHLLGFVPPPFWLLLLSSQYRHHHFFHRSNTQPDCPSGLPCLHDNATTRQAISSYTLPFSPYALGLCRNNFAGALTHSPPQITDTHSHPSLPPSPTPSST